MAEHEGDCCESCLQDWEAGWVDDLGGACCCHWFYTDEAVDLSEDQ